MIDYVAAGTTAGKLAEAACGTIAPCQVAYMIAVPGYPPSDVYKNAFETETKTHPNIQVIGTYPTGYDDISKARNALQDALVKYPKVAAVVSDAGWLAGAEQLAQERGLSRQISFIDCGGSKASIAAITSGEAYGTVPYLPQTIAEVATRMAISAVRGQPVTDRVVNASSLSPLAASGITKSDVGTFEGQY